MKIDFVIIWVDSNDPDWQKEKSKYAKNSNGDRSIIRYRDWENLKYLFRGIEKYAKWVNNVYFVTCGHLPSWLNTECDKLKIVKHSDYMPKEYLPTFNANPIEMNLHRIKGLEEHFVFFNDDMFLTNHVKKEDFFKNGMPCELAALNAVTPSNENIVSYIWFNDWAIINKHFDKRKCIKKNLNKWINIKYGKENLRTLQLMPWKKFLGFKFTHLPTSLLKSTYYEVWQKEYDVLNSTSLNKFRTKNDVNQYLIKDWQICQGKFYPRSNRIGKIYDVSKNNIENIVKDIKNKKHKMICINDGVIDEEQFEIYKKRIIDAFEQVLPEKSNFEK